MISLQDQSINLGSLTGVVDKSVFELKKGDVVPTFYRENEVLLGA